MNDHLSSKTFFILDCSKKYLDTNSGQHYDIGFKVRSTLISKSLFTCTVEAIFEYSRIVWDLFPNGEKTLLFLSCSPESTYFLNSWHSSQQNCESLLNSFFSLSNTSIGQTAKFEKDDKSKMFLIDGFKKALINFVPEPDTMKFNKNTINAGRIIIITYENENDFIKNFKIELLKEFNKYNETSETPISELEVVLINNYPINNENVLFKDLPIQNLSKKLKFSLHSVASSSILATKLIYMVFEHYNLASTTVCNIPMKEEQNSGTSANYDVEIVHSRKAHEEFFQNNEYTDINSFYSEVKRENQKYNSLQLKWYTPPKNHSLELNYCIGVHRITAIDVNNRPSSCLLNFLHSGKTVVLETYRKAISHILKCHNGELFIHVLSINRPLIEDAPSISEGVGGRITDYRINEFAELMKKTQLSLLSSKAENNGLEQAEILLKKQTLYWPISLGLTVFFNIRDQSHHFYQMISKRKLTEEDFLELRNIIYKWAKSEVDGFSLPIQSNIIRSKGLKKEDMYRILWNEMEHIIRCYNVSPLHQQTLQCYLDIKPKNDNNPFQIINNHNNNNHHHQNEDSTPSFRNDSNLNSKKSRTFFNGINYEQIKSSMESLKDIFIARMEAKRKRPDFIGRNAKVVKLYSGLNEDK